MLLYVSVCLSVCLVFVSVYHLNSWRGIFQWERYVSYALYFDFNNHIFPLIPNFGIYVEHLANENLKGSYIQTRISKDTDDM